MPLASEIRSQKETWKLRMVHPKGGYSLLFFVRRLGPRNYSSPPKIIRNFKQPQKIFETLATQKISPILYLDLKKDPKCIGMTLKYCSMTPQKYSQNLYNQKSIYFSENQKNIEIENFEPQKMSRVYVWLKILVYPPWDATRVDKNGLFWLFENQQRLIYVPASPVVDPSGTQNKSNDYHDVPDSVPSCWRAKHLPHTNQLYSMSLPQLPVKGDQAQAAGSEIRHSTTSL